MDLFPHDRELAHQLELTAGHVARREKLERRLKRLQHERIELATDLDELRRKRDKEDRQAAALDQPHRLASLLWQALGSYEQHRKHERQDAIQAQIRLDEAHHALAHLNRTIELVQREIQALDGVEHDYRALLDRKAAAIQEAGRESAGELFQWGELLAVLQWRVAELNEAITAGDHAVAGLHLLRTSLDAVGPWTPGDPLRHRVDEIQAEVRDVHQRLAAFCRELQDLGFGLPPATQEDVAGFMGLAGAITDSLVAGDLIQRPITSRGRVERTRQRVLDLVQALRDQCAKAQADLTIAREQHDRFIRRVH